MPVALNQPPDVTLAQRLDELAEPLFGYALSRAVDRDMALDAVQEALVAAVGAARGGREFRDAEALWAWLLRVVRNKLIDELRRRRVRGPTVSSLGVDVDLLAGAVRSGRALPDDVAARSEVAALCRAAIAELPPAWQAALRGCYLEGLTQPQLARRLGISVKAVESLLARARKALLAVLNHRLEHPEELL